MAELKHPISKATAEAGQTKPAKQSYFTLTVEPSRHESTKLEQHDSGTGAGEAHHHRGARRRGVGGREESPPEKGPGPVARTSPHGSYWEELSLREMSSASRSLSPVVAVSSQIEVIQSPMSSKMKVSSIDEI